MKKLIKIFSGMKKYCESYAKGIYNVSMDFGPVPKFEGEMLENVNEQLNQICPLNKLQERRTWRDTALMKLSILKKEMNGL